MLDSTGPARAAAAKSLLSRVFYAALFLLLVTFSGHVYAQQYAGTIVGTVTDATGAAVPGATVVARNTGTNATMTATTSNQGEYAIAQVPGGALSDHDHAGEL